MTREHDRINTALRNAAHRNSMVVDADTGRVIRPSSRFAEPESDDAEVTAMAPGKADGGARPPAALTDPVEMVNAAIRRAAGRSG